MLLLREILSISCDFQTSIFNKQDEHGSEKLMYGDNLILINKRTFSMVLFHSVRAQRAYFTLNAVSALKQLANILYTRSQLT